MKKIHLMLRQSFPLGTLKRQKILLFFLSLPLLANAQSPLPDSLIKRNTVYGEAFGQGLLYSLSYDRLHLLHKNFKTSYTGGLIIIPYSLRIGGGSYYGIPVSYNFLYGRKSHYLELGLGLTAVVGNDFSTGEEIGVPFSYMYSYFTPKIGYRMQPRRGGLFFRFTFSPMIAFINYEYRYYRWDFFNNVAGLSYPAFPWPGLSLGATF